MGKSCSCYCGVATKSNRYKWAVAGILALMGTIFLISFFALAEKCASGAVLECDSDDWRDSPDPVFFRKCQQAEEQEQQCIASDIGILGPLELLWLLCWVGASIPLYMMCCCSEPPHLVPLEGIQLGLPSDWRDPNAQALQDSPEEDEALLSPKFYSSIIKPSATSLPQQ